MLLAFPFRGEGVGVCEKWSTISFFLDIELCTRSLIVYPPPPVGPIKANNEISVYFFDKDCRYHPVPALQLTQVL